MGTYYNPAADVTEGRVGRLITPIRGSDHATAMHELRPGEHLYAAMDRLVRWNVVCVDEKSEFDYFYKLYSQGHYLTFNLYALSEDQHRSVT